MSRSFVLTCTVLLATASASGPRISLVQGYSFDPLTATPELPPELTIDGLDGEYGYYIIQFPGPVLPEWKRAVERAGADLLWYLPQYAFIARARVRGVDYVASLPEVRWVGLFQPAYKLSPGLEKARGLRELIVVFFNDEDEHKLMDEIRALGGYGIETSFNQWNKSVKVTVDGGRIDGIARLPGVFWIEPYGEITPDNMNVQWVDQHGYSASDTTRTIWAKGLTGRGVTVSITDTPLWMSHDLFRDTVSNTPGPSHRKVIRYVGTQSRSQHGTHTTGTLCGNDGPVGGSSWNDGLCKDSKVVFQNYSALSGNWDMNDWFARPESGVGSLKGWNHSMSLSRKDTYNIYIFADMTADQFVWNHRHFMHCNSMGNLSGNQMGHPVIAKNIISTGATGNGTSCRSFATYSSRGPTSDGRRKPQLVSPGTAVYSASHTDSTGYAGLSGTSMATPNMTASTALVREYFRAGFYPTGDTTTGSPMEISAALNKAVVIVGADNSMTGYTVPDDNIGWGRVDLDSSLYFSGDASRLWVVDDTAGISTGDSMVYTIGIGNSGRPFRVALCWSDYPGTMQASYILVNDLDLTVISPGGTEYKGNVWSGGQSTTGGIYDTLNVEECFRINSPATGNWRIKVKARNAPQGPQPYAIAAIGITGSVTVHDVGVTSLQAPTGVVDSGSTVAPACSVYNYGNQTESYAVRMRIGAGYDTTATISSHTPGATLYLTFPSWTASTRGWHPVSCSTELSNDINRSNDRSTDSVVVRVRDVGANTILAPTGSVDSGTVVTPACSLHNYGNSTESYQVRMRIGTVYNATATVSNHPPGTAEYLTFTNWTAGARGAYAVSCSTELATDVYRSNDKVTGSVAVQVRDVAATRILTPAGTIDSGTVVTPACSVYNYGTTTESYDVLVRIGTAFGAVGAVSNHQPSTRRYVTFTNWTASPRGTFPVACSTLLATDAKQSNDKVTGSVTVQVKDVGVTVLLAPTGVVDSGSTVAPACSVYNWGSANETYAVRMRIGSYDQTAVVSGHVPGTRQYVTFPTWTADQRGAFAVTCSSELAGDRNNNNDRQEGAVFVRVLDVAAVAVVEPVGSYPNGSIVGPAGTWRNNTNAAITFDAWMLLDDPDSGRVYERSIAVSGLASGSDTTIASFPTWVLVSNGTWLVRCSTYLVGDVLPSNDMALDSCVVSDPDMGVAALLQPSGRMDTGTVVVPRAVIRNYGIIDMQFQAWFSLTDPTDVVVYRRTLTVDSLAPGDSTVLTWPSYAIGAQQGGWAAKCSVEVPGDGNPDNDWQLAGFKVTTLPLWPDGWTEVASVPVMPSGKPVKRGGWLVYDEGEGLIFAAKGYKTPDVYSYSPLGNYWISMPQLPIGPDGRGFGKGAEGTTDGNGNLYLTKGNNTLEFWHLSVAANTWTRLPDVPYGPTRKRVKGGTDLVYVARGSGDWVYMLKGYKNEFWRYSIGDSTWQALENAPTGQRAKWKKGSWLVYDGANGLLAHKARYHELWRYDLVAQEWDSLPLTGMPFFGMLGRRKKSKDGGSAVLSEGQLFALKGGNTQEFWRYEIDTGVWTELDTLPAWGSTGRKKRVKYGADLVTVGVGVFYATKGNKTVEMWRYVVPSTMSPQPRPRRSGVLARPVERRPYCTDLIPNPLVEGFVRLRFNLPNPGPAQVEVVDVGGRRVTQRSLLLGRSGTQTLDLRGLSAGVYLVKLEAGGFESSHKLVVQRE